MFISLFALLSLLFTSSLTIFVLLTLALLTLLFYLLRPPPSPSLLHWSGLVMGHRGCRTNLNIPENSLQAFQYAHEHGADAIELDCQLTRDGRIVCMHDGTVDRVCEVVGEGEWAAGREVGDMTFEEVNGLVYRRTGKKEREREPVEPEREKRRRWNAATPHTASPATSSPSTPAQLQPLSSSSRASSSFTFSPASVGSSSSTSPSSSTPSQSAVPEYGDDWTPSMPYPDTLLATERLDGPPSLEQVVRFAHARRLKIMIEMKEYRNPALLLRQLLALFDAHPWLYRHAYIATFNPWHVWLIRRLSPALPSVLLYCRDVLQWYHDDRSKEMQLPALLNFRWARWLVDQLLLYGLPLLVAFLRPSGIGPHSPLMSVSQAEDNRHRSLLMDVWVCNRSAEVQLWREEGALVTTDWCFPKHEEKRGGQKWSGGGAEAEEEKRRREWMGDKAREEEKVRLEDERLERLMESEVKRQFDVGTRR